MGIFQRKEIQLITLMDLKIIIGVDAHNPDDLDCSDIDQVLDFCKRLNLNISEKIDFK